LQNVRNVSARKHAELITREAHYLYTLLCRISKASEVCMDHTDTARSLTG